MTATTEGVVMILSFSELINIIREDLETYKNDWLRPGFQALAFHRFGNWARVARPRLIRRPLVGLSKALFIFARNFYGIELPIQATIGRHVIIEHQGGIVVHGNAVIGNGCRLRQGVTLGIKSMDDLGVAPRLGFGVDVGAGAKILGYVVVGDYATIGANAVVLKDVPAGATAVGTPARVLPPKNDPYGLFRRHVQLRPMPKDPISTGELHQFFSNGVKRPNS